MRGEAPPGQLRLFGAPPSLYFFWRQNIRGFGRQGFDRQASGADALRERERASFALPAPLAAPLSPRAGREREDGVEGALSAIGVNRECLGGPAMVQGSGSGNAPSPHPLPTRGEREEQAPAAERINHPFGPFLRTLLTNQNHEDFGGPRVEHHPPAQSLMFRARSYTGFIIMPQPPIEWNGWRTLMPVSAIRKFFAGYPIVVDLSAVTLSTNAITQLFANLEERNIPCLSASKASIRPPRRRVCRR